jgi:hypothetical protein
MYSSVNYTFSMPHTHKLMLLGKRIYNFKSYLTPKACFIQFFISTQSKSSVNNFIFIFRLLIDLYSTEIGKAQLQIENFGEELLTGRA